MEASPLLNMYRYPYICIKSRLKWEFFESTTCTMEWLISKASITIRLSHSTLDLSYHVHIRFWTDSLIIQSLGPVLRHGSEPIGSVQIAHMYRSHGVGTLIRYCTCRCRCSFCFGQDHFHTCFCRARGRYSIIPLSYPGNAMRIVFARRTVSYWEGWLRLGVMTREVDGMDSAWFLSQPGSLRSRR
jgi:hypothetical protein